MNTQNPTVSLHAYPFGAGMVKIDVQLYDVPADLFGAAFHLVLEGVDGQGWTLYKYELGDVFGASHGEIMALASSRNEPKNELVVGMSLKRDAVIEARDGTLISFYVKLEDANTLSLRFEDAVLSVLQEQRIDLPNVVWREARIDLHNETQASVLAGVNDERPYSPPFSTDTPWLAYGLFGGAFILVFLFFVRFCFLKKTKHLT